MSVHAKVKRIPLKYNGTTYRPGDWVELESHGYAARLEADDLIMIPKTSYKTLFANLGNAGIVCKEGNEQIADTYSLSLSHQDLFDTIPYDCNAWIDGNFQLNSKSIPKILSSPGRLAASLLWLDTWDVLIPLASSSYNKIAHHLTSVSDKRDKLQAIIKDLRVPYYNPSVIIFAKNKRVRSFLESYKQQLEEFNNAPMALLASLYIVKPYFYPLPDTWS